MKRLLTILSLAAAPVTLAYADDAKPTKPAAPKDTKEQTRFVPLAKDGKPYGLKVFVIKPGSRHDKQGFKNGDAIVAIDGKPVTELSDVAVVEVLIEGTRGGKVDLDRDNKRMTLTVEKIGEAKK